MTDWSPLARSLQALPPPDAHACLGVRRFVHESLAVPSPWPLCVAAVSGGLDSSVMALVLHLLGMPLVLAHLDHGLRAESADDAKHVAELARALGLACEIETVDVAAEAAQQKQGLEEAGRIRRYALFERVRQKYGAAWIVTGHHLDDLEEDVLLRLIRGGGWPALGGMAARDDARKLLRPLLHTPRACLHSLAVAAQLPWREDASNAQRDFRRNRIRHDILPLIRAENPGFAQNVRRVWELARMDIAYWEQHIGSCEGDCEILLARERLDALAPAARVRLYLVGVRQLCCARDAGERDGGSMRETTQGTHRDAKGRGGQARADALLDLERLWQAKRTGAVVQMPGVSARITKEGIFLYRL